MDVECVRNQVLCSRGSPCPGEGLALRFCSSQMKLECNAAFSLLSPQFQLHGFLEEKEMKPKRQLTLSVFIVMTFYGKSFNHNEAKASTVTPASASSASVPLVFPCVLIVLLYCLCRRKLQLNLLLIAFPSSYFIFGTYPASGVLPKLLEIKTEIQMMGLILPS